MVGVGIGGAKAAENELNKPATGFFGSIMISAKEHGYQTSVNMYNWISGKAVPPAEVLTKGMLMTRANQAEVVALASVVTLASVVALASVVPIFVALVFKRGRQL